MSWPEAMVAAVATVSVVVCATIVALARLRLKLTPAQIRARRQPTQQSEETQS